MIKLRYGLLMAMMISLIGCAVGPDYERPQTVVDDLPDFHQDRAEDRTTVSRNTDPNQTLVGAKLSEDRWWEHFGDPVTAALVRKALRNNTNLQAQAARVLQAEALLRQSQAPLGPQANLGYQIDRTSRTFVLPQPAGRVTTRATTHNPSLNVSYILDFFGRLQRSNEAAEATLLQRTANYEALQHSIIAQVVRSRVQIATTQRLLDIARKNHANWNIALEIAERRYRQGLIGSLEVHVARENVARSQALIPSLELSLQQAYHALDVLLGQAPGSTDELDTTLSALPDLTPVPDILPADLLERRPDIREAEHRLHAATARVGVNVAQLYPNITLSGSVGYSADKFSDLFQNETLIWSLAAGLTQPLFRNGEIRGQIDEAKAVVQEELAIYSGVILTALNEVEDALIQERKLQEQLTSIERRYTEAQASEKLAQERYIQGVEQLTTVLETERARREAEDQLTQIKGNIWNTRVELLLALGGDWQTKDTAPDPTAAQAGRSGSTVARIE